MARGSVRKRCQCRDEQGRRVKGCRKPHGSWSYTIDAGPDPDTGRRRQVFRGGFDTRDEATQAMTRELAAIDAGTWTDDKGVTVGEWLDVWLGMHQGAVKTVIGYRTHVEQLWRPAIGHLKLRDLRRHHVERALADLGKPVTGRRPGRVGRPVAQRSPKTLDSYRRTLRAALSEAVRQQLITVNVAEGRMSSIPTRDGARGEGEIWQVDELGRFLDASAGHRFGALFEVAAYAGLRRGELCGARWSDLDEDGAGITIRQTIVEAPSKGIPADLRRCPQCGAEHTSLVVKDTKSRAGQRWVPFVEPVQATLVGHRLAQADDKHRLGPDYADHGLIFAQVDGNPLRPDTVSRQFVEVAREVGLRPVRLHDLRHSAASMLLAAGVPIEVVQMILGHSSPDVTRRIYAHVIRDATAAQVGRAARLLDPHRGNRPNG